MITVTALALVIYLFGDTSILKRDKRMNAPKCRNKSLANTGTVKRKRLNI
jgi:hypothetical protein